MNIYSNSLPKFQSLSEIPAPHIFPQTPAGEFLARHYPLLRPSLADLVARLVGLGSEGE